MSNKKNIPDKLNEIPKESPFGVPEGYFENFRDRLQMRISTEAVKTKEVPVRKLRPRITWAVSVAAVLILGLGVFKFLVPHQQPAELSKAEISAYLQQDAYNLDESELYDDYNDVYDANENTSATSSREEYKDQIVEYLLDEDVEVSQITAKL